MVEDVVKELEFTDDKETKEATRPKKENSAKAAPSPFGNTHRVTLDAATWLRALAGSAQCAEVRGQKVSVSKFIGIAIDAYLEANGIEPAAYFKKVLR